MHTCNPKNSTNTDLGFRSVTTGITRCNRICIRSIDGCICFVFICRIADNIFNSPSKSICSVSGIGCVCSTFCNCCGKCVWGWRACSERYGCAGTCNARYFCSFIALEENITCCIFTGSECAVDSIFTVNIILECIHIACCRSKINSLGNIKCYMRNEICIFSALEISINNIVTCSNSVIKIWKSWGNIA